MDRALLVLALGVLVGVATFALRSRRREAPARVRPGDFGLSGDGLAVVGFSSRLCRPCQAWEAALSDAGIPFVKVDVPERLELVRRYRVAETPLVLAIGLPDGRVLASFRGEPRTEDVEWLRERVAAPLSA